MITTDILFHVLGITVIFSPIVLLAILGGCSLVGYKLSERLISRFTQIFVSTGLVAVVGILILMLSVGTRYVPLELGNWASLPEQHFQFHFKFIFDRLSVPFVILTFVLCGTVGVFSSRYLHREPGFRRFFVCYALFLNGMVICALAGTIETLFLGWELVGLSSALLIAYFHDRLGPVRNGQRVWSIYRLSDAVFLIAALTMHRLTGAGDFGSFVGDGPWPEGATSISEYHALLVGSLLLVAAAGKSGLVPFSGWVPRAMEGPTPSSAVFYGALSIHLGAYLLLRVSPIIEASFVLQAMIITVGLLTAIFGSLISRVQGDIKSSLAYASLAQVGIIVVEIGLGLYYLALIHIIGHACMRTLQLLRSPTLLHDYHTMENAIGSDLIHQRSFLSRSLPDGFHRWWYRFAFERGYMDQMLENWIVRPFTRLLKMADRAERGWTNWLSREDQASANRDASAVKTKPDQDSSTEAV